MKLYYSQTSPFARKVLVTALEKGQELELVPALPWENDPALLASNPLGKIPALVLENGRTYCDSPLICEYLDMLTEEPRLIPQAAEGRLEVLRLDALALGIMDAGVKLTIEMLKRPPELLWEEWKERQEQAITRTLGILEAETVAFSGELRLHHITLATALGYLDFRHDYLGWRLGHPQLTKWYEKFSQRPSMQETAPPAE